MKTYYPKGKKGEDETTKTKWFLVDAAGAVPGRLASKIAIRLRGKHRADYTPGVDMGDGIIVVNASKIKFTGDKLNQKIYYKHSGYPGSLKKTPLSAKIEKNPNEVLYLAVKGMLPRGPLGRAMLRRLRIYQSADHPHSGQNPAVLELQ